MKATNENNLVPRTFFLPPNLKTQLILSRTVILFVFLRGVGVIRVCERAVFFRVKVVLLSSCEL